MPDESIPVATGRPLEVGLFLPVGDIAYRGSPSSWEDVLGITKRAEELGFDSIWLADHLLADFGWESEPRLSVRECWSLLSVLAAVTSRIELGPLVCCTAYRSPTMLAVIADTVQEISGNRLRLGLGAGWHEPEFHAFGFPFDHRVSRFEEAIQIITRLLRGGRVTFDGSYYQARDCELRTKGPRPATPPMVIGAKGPRMMELTARYADVWDSDFLQDPADHTQVREKLALLDTAREAVGRNPSSLQKSVSIRVNLPGYGTPDDHPLLEGRAKTLPASGSPEELTALLHAYAAEGISRVQVWLDPNTVEGVEAFAPVLELLDRS